MCKATAKYMKQLEAYPNALPDRSDAALKWMVFPEVKEESETGESVDGTIYVRPKVLTFDEATGTLTNQQDSRNQQGITIKTVETIPWTTWLETETSRPTGCKAKSVSAATFTLQGLHKLWVALPSPPVKIIQTSTTTKVVALRDLKENDLFFPPCAPRNCKVLENSVHPHRVPIIVKNFVGKAEPEKVGDTYAAPAVADTTTYYVNPEWKLPARNAKGEWIWNGDESMHVLWGVRRLTPAEQGTEKAEANCGFLPRDYTNVSVGVMAGGEPVSITTIVTIQYLTNTSAVKEGAELVIGMPTPEKKEKRKVNWKDDMKNEKEDKAKAAKKEEITSQKKGANKIAYI